VVKTVNVHLHPADLVFIRGNRLLDEPIKIITGSKYTHVAGSVKKHTLVEAQGLRKTGYQSMETYLGVADIYTCPALTDRQRAEVIHYVLQQVGSRYDYLLLLWEALRYILGVVLPYFKTRRKICSTLWADAYKAAGIDLCPGVKYPTPGDLANSPLLVMVGSK
jgi:uncharacterized protein YycO